MKRQNAHTQKTNTQTQKNKNKTITPERDDARRERRVIGLEEARQAKVAEPQAAGAVVEQVAELDVAVRDPARVQERERRQQLFFGRVLFLVDLVWLFSFGGGTCSRER